MNGFSVFGGGFGGGGGGHFQRRLILRWRRRRVLALLAVVAAGCFWEEGDSAQAEAADFGRNATPFLVVADSAQTEAACIAAGGGGCSWLFWCAHF